MSKRLFAAAALALSLGFGTAYAQGSIVPPMATYQGSVTPSGGYTGDVAIGSATAPITIVEYASLSCPHCASFHASVFPALKSAYIDTGKVRFIFRDYPLNETAFTATIVARCGGAENYLQLASLFLSTQDEWIRAEDWMTRIEEIGVRGGVDRQRINACFKDGPLFESVNERKSAAAATHGRFGTPTFIINGQMYRGRDDFQSMSQALDGIL